MRERVVACRPWQRSRLQEVGQGKRPESAATAAARSRAASRAPPSGPSIFRYATCASSLRASRSSSSSLVAGAASAPEYLVPPLGLGSAPRRSPRGTDGTKRRGRTCPPHRSARSPPAWPCLHRPPSARYPLSSRTRSSRAWQTSPAAPSSRSSGTSGAIFSRPRGARRAYGRRRTPPNPRSKRSAGLPGCPAVFRHEEAPHSPDISFLSKKWEAVKAPRKSRDKKRGAEAPALAP